MTKDINAMSPKDLEELKKSLEERIEALEEEQNNPDNLGKFGDKLAKLEELRDEHSDVENRLENDLFISIEGEIYDVDNVRRYGYLPMLEMGSTEFYVAETSAEAGEKAKEYWQDMADNDPKEFACIVGEETLIQWGLGRSAGPGSTHVRSLEEWLDLSLDNPEEQWASYDGSECSVDWVSPALEAELGYTPEVAYRHN